MSEGHLVLIVEDDAETADALQQIVSAEGWRSVIVDNRTDAVSRLQANKFCIVILDLQIKGDGNAIKGHTSHGKALLRQIRQLHQEHTGRAFWLPVVVVSGFASERAEAIEIMRDGAATLIEKPFKDRVIVEKLHAELERCGRDTHERCSRPPVSQPEPDGQVAIELPGSRDGRRTEVLVAGHTLSLPDSELRTLLELIAAHQSGKTVHKVALGHKKHQGFKAVSRLRLALKPALGSIDVITNDRHGEYGLTNAVVVRCCNAAKFGAVDDARIISLAETIEKSLK